MSKEYIIYKREIQEVQNRLQDVHDYNETTRQMGDKNSREAHYRSWNCITQPNGKRNVGHPIKSSYWMTFYGTRIIIITTELAENNK